jgi:hydroxymethylpyrimidine/phosphomethylpyrimidine kinase
MLPITLTIAGSGSGGGAGIQADLKTFHAFGTFGTSVVTAITAQNTLGVSHVHPVPIESVRAQIEAVALDLAPRAVKTGMLATAELVRLVAEAASEHDFRNLVLDPVMVSTSGHRLLDPDAEETVRDALLPRAALVTPNLNEAAILVGFPVESEDDMLRAARALVERGAAAALVKGGHGKEDRILNLLWDGSSLHEWRTPRLSSRNTHGTGCTLSAAIAAGLARGKPLRQATGAAIDFVHRAIGSAPGLGSGHGPLNHLVPVGE